MQFGKLGHFFLFLGAFALLLGAAGCSKTMYGAVKFESNPPGAEVVNLRDDATLGVTPVLVHWESSDGQPEYVTVQMRKNGYLEDITSFWVNTRHESREAASVEPQPIFSELKQRRQP
ncbi:MAG: hypothetical protein RBT36_10900 [Desulfobulbus sp.]|jgi:hypothetical protein|nr:hypothetical protein [Desulfobulbus sp.]